MPKRRTRNAAAGETATITAHSYETLAKDYPLTFAVPYGDLPGNDHFEYTWHLIQYAFDLPDPGQFPALSGSLLPDEHAVLQRYVIAAQDLAESAFLRHPISLSINLAGAEESIAKEFPPNENIRGFSVLFRQFHSNEEGASFQSIQRVLRLANDRACDAHVEDRKEQLTAWARAVAKLRGHELKVLVGKRLQREGRWASELLPGEDTSPQMLISLYNYGEDIHWGRHRELVAALNADPFHAAWRRMSFFDAVAGLAHVFLGFSVLAEKALETGAGD